MPWSTAHTGCPRSALATARAQCSCEHPDARGDNVASLLYMTKSSDVTCQNATPKRDSSTRCMSRNASTSPRSKSSSGTVVALCIGLARPTTRGCVGVRRARAAVVDVVGGGVRATRAAAVGATTTKRRRRKRGRLQAATRRDSTRGVRRRQLSSALPARRYRSTRGERACRRRAPRSARWRQRCGGVARAE
jgi:hypothetical protein